LEKLEQRKAKLAAEIQKVKAREATASRKADTRKKIIVGAVVLGMMERGDGIPKNALFAALDKSVIRPLDRLLFNLPPLSPDPPERG
jgi:hypothetical protein